MLIHLPTKATLIQSDPVQESGIQTLKPRANAGIPGEVGSKLEERRPLRSKSSSGIIIE